MTSLLLKGSSLLLLCSLSLAGPSLAADVKLKLTGADEVPSVTTQASGTGTISVGDDKSVSGSVTTTGITGVAAHIHLAAPGKNGPPIITLTKSSDTVWTVPAGSKLTDEQYASFKAGDLYVNVHSAAPRGGEIRGQIKP
jgi:hypothetical protein